MPSSNSSSVNVYIHQHHSYWDVDSDGTYLSTQYSSPPTYYHHGYYHTHSHVQDDPWIMFWVFLILVVLAWYFFLWCLPVGRRAERDVTPQGPAPVIEFDGGEGKGEV